MNIRLKKRCQWAPLNDELYLSYHDSEWGVPVYDDLKLFEFLILEGFQAGLSWSTILRKRDNFRKAFDYFDPKKIAQYNEEDIRRLCTDSGIVRNKLKIQSTINNAQRFCELMSEEESFSDVLWQFVNGRPLVNEFKILKEIPAETDESRSMSHELKARGFRFVGPTICYAFMQAVGMVNDHTIDCYRYEEIQAFYENAV
jgi:DNA-3-methyladenine glycosylase I